jgi:hypothetical protein
MIIAYDCETSLTQPGLAAPPLACGSFAWFAPDGSIKSKVLDAPGAVAELRSLLRDRRVVILGHSVAFDLVVAAAWVFDHEGIEAGEEFLDLIFLAHHEGRVRDTDMRERLIAIAAGTFAEDRDYAYSLATLAKQRLGIELDKDGGHRHSFGQFVGKPLSAFSAKHLEYAADDAMATLLVWDSQAVDCPDYVLPNPVSGVHGVWHEVHCTKKSLALMLMRVWGVRTDPEYVADLERRMLDEEREVMRDLVTAGILVKHKKAGNNTYTKKTKPIRDRVVAAFMRAGRQVPMSNPSSKFPSGQVKTDADTCEIAASFLIDDPDPEVRRIGRELKLVPDYNGVTQILDTYVPALKQGTVVPVNAFWNPQLKSDRTSCGSPNWQNPPQAFGVRQCVIPGPGQVLCSNDLDTVELRSLADFNYETFGYSMMRERICQGVDLHMSLGGKLLGFEYEWGKAHKNDPLVRKGRKMAKPTNFGRPGGMGDLRFVDMARKQYGVTFSLDEARHHKQVWLHENPEMVQFFNYVKQLTPGGSGTVTTPRSGMITGGRSYPAACNQHFQGPVAYAATDAQFYVSWECYVRRPSHRGGAESALYGSRPVLFVHDEIVSAMPIGRAHEAAMRQGAVMVERVQPVFPNVPITTSPALMLRWYKEAEAAYGEDGKLMPWEIAAVRELFKGLAA